MDARNESEKRIVMPCYGTKCQICGWSPARSNKNKICRDYRQDRPFVDLKPWGYKKDGRRYWRFE